MSIEIEDSHGRPRVQTRGIDPLPPRAAPAPTEGKDPSTGRFAAGNALAKRRAIKRHAKGLATLNPKECAPWLAPFASLGAEYAVSLAERFDDPVLARLVGACADAASVTSALMSLAAKGDMTALAEARKWSQESRAILTTLTALSASIAKDDPRPDPYAFIAHLAAENEAVTAAALPPARRPDPNERRDYLDE